MENLPSSNLRLAIESTKAEGKALGIQAPIVSCWMLRQTQPYHEAHEGHEGFKIFILLLRALRDLRGETSFSTLVAV
jgi:hypothetical protein